jgi:hypothetical protein
MTSYEVQMVVSLARDPSYVLPDWVSAASTQQWLQTASRMADNVGEDGYPCYQEDPDDCVFLFVEDLVVFVREYCLYDDLSPNSEPLTRWLRLFSSPFVQMAELTPESWGKVLTSKVIEKMKT